MSSFPNFFGNRQAAQTLAQMIESGRIPQTILLSGPEGVGKSTLARRFAAALLKDTQKVEQDDLSLPTNLDVVEQREKWPAEKRADDPLLFSSHPDFVTFTPDGPLRQITMQQMRLLRERAQFKPLRGSWRVFLIDHLERANEQSANSLLKVLEEPPEHLVLFSTTENLYDILPTIRSRSIVLQLGRLSDEELMSFVQERGLPDAEARVSLSDGCPGIAAGLELERLRERRTLMLAAFECGAGVTPFHSWVQSSESFNGRRTEKLEPYLKIGYSLLGDILRGLHSQPALRNRDIGHQIQKLAERVSMRWVERAVACLDELVLMVRRNIQKTPALDGMIITLRKPVES